MPESADNLFSVRDLIDSQLETSDRVKIGRVADIEAEWHEDGSLVVTHLLTGPQALAGRVSSPLRTLLQRLLHDRFEHQLSIQEVQKFGPTLKLHGKARDYAIGQSESWIANHILRWIPGSGH